MTRVHENRNLRNRSRVFTDRQDAGRTLADMLAGTYRGGDVVLLAIPMGGVPVAVEIRARLNCPLDLVIVRKLQIPGNTEAGFGAMTQEGDLFLNEPLLMQLGLKPSQVDRQANIVKGDLRHRNKRLRSDRPFPDLAGRTVIVVDDGLASGFTMKAAVHMVNKRRAAQTVVAVPTAPMRTIDALKDAVDAVYCPNVRNTVSFAVADAYKNWRDLEEPEVAALLGA